MGHERVGRLPRTQRWSHIIAAVAQQPADEDLVKQLAFGTLEAVGQRLTAIERDRGVQAAFQFLVAISQPHGTPLPQGLSQLAPDAHPLFIAARLHAYVETHRGSAEYAAIAKQAGADAIAQWTRKGADQQALFGQPGASEVWGRAASGAGFSEVSRLFFSSFTERYIKYFLDREASAALPTVDARERFSRELKKHVDVVSRHAFETSKITQSFAAGWYNKNARGRVPNPTGVRGFLAIAFGKIREELRREARA